MSDTVKKNIKKFRKLNFITSFKIKVQISYISVLYRSYNENKLTVQEKSYFCQEKNINFSPFFRNACNITILQQNKTRKKSTSIQQWMKRVYIYIIIC